MSCQSPFNNKTESITTQESVAEDFDNFTEMYEDKINEVITFGGLEHSFYIDVKRNEILQQIDARFCDMNKLNVLDLGCGIGVYHSSLVGNFRQLYGIDVSEKSINLARKKNPFVIYDKYDGNVLPYSNNFFDVIFTICVMHHVPKENWQNFVKEIYRVLKPGGIALVFEHNPYNPATQYIVRNCEIDKDAVLLSPKNIRNLFAKAGFDNVYTRTILSIPPILKFLYYIDRFLGYLPFGAQYYLCSTKPK